VRIKASISSPRGIVPQKLSAAQYCSAVSHFSMCWSVYDHDDFGLGGDGDGADAGGHHVQLSSGQDGQATRQQGTFKYINLSLGFSGKQLKFFVFRYLVFRCCKLLFLLQYLRLLDEFAVILSRIRTLTVYMFL
jgi:hypothetical protein